MINGINSFKTVLYSDLKTKREYKSKYIYIDGIIDEYNDVLHVQNCLSN